MREDMRTLANTDSGMVLLREILADIPPDTLSGLVCQLLFRMLLSAI